MGFYVAHIYRLTWKMNVTELLAITQLITQLNNEANNTMLTVLLGFIWRGYVVAKLRYAPFINKAYR